MVTHGLLKIRPNMTPTDFEKCRFCLFVGSSYDVMLMYSHMPSYIWVRRWFDKRVWLYWPRAFLTKVPKYHALIILTDFLCFWWYLIIIHDLYNPSQDSSVGKTSCHLFRRSAVRILLGAKNVIAFLVPRCWSLKTFLPAELSQFQVVRLEL